MLSAKIATSLIALMLLLPLGLTFWFMSTYRFKTDAELRKSIEGDFDRLKAEIEKQVTPDFPGASAFMIQGMDQMKLPHVSQRLWMMYPRRGVGIAGLACVTILVILIAISTWLPGHSVMVSYGKEGGPFVEPTNDKAAPDTVQWFNGPPKEIIKKEK